MSTSRGSKRDEDQDVQITADKENCNPNEDQTERLTLGDGLENQIIYHEDEALPSSGREMFTGCDRRGNGPACSLAEMSQGWKKKLSQEAVRDKIKRNRDKISKAVAQRARERGQKLKPRKAKEKLLIATKKPRSKGKLHKHAGHPSENGSKQRRVGEKASRKTSGQKWAKEPSEKGKKEWK